MKRKFIYFFLFPYLMLLLVTLSFVLTNAHGTEILWFNRYGIPSLDLFFKYWTYVGDGWVFAVVFAGFMIFKRWKEGIALLVLGGIQLIVSSVMKRVIFHDTPRPRTYFDGKEVLEFVEGIKIYGHYSFPSGHTMTAFALAAFLALIINDRLWSLVLLISAGLVAVSRMYLLQHFAVDVMAGSAIGILLAWLVVALMQKYAPESQVTS